MKNRLIVVPFIVLIPIGFMITLAYILDKREKFEPGGETSYMHYCSGCHGKKGDGRGITARVKRLDTPNFSSTEYWEYATDEEMLDIIKNGQDKMPKFERFVKEADRKEILKYIKRKFKPKPVESYNYE